MTRFAVLEETETMISSEFMRILQTRKKETRKAIITRLGGGWGCSHIPQVRDPQPAREETPFQALVAREGVFIMLFMRLSRKSIRSMKRFIDVVLSRSHLALNGEANRRLVVEAQLRRGLTYLLTKRFRILTRTHSGFRSVLIVHIAGGIGPQLAMIPRTKVEHYQLLKSDGSGGRFGSSDRRARSREGTSSTRNAATQNSQKESTMREEAGSSLILLYRPRKYSSMGWLCDILPVFLL